MKKTFSLLLAVMMCVLMTACTATAESYTAATAGFGGEIAVTLTIEDAKIVDALVKGDSETVGVGSIAVERLAKDMVEKNTVTPDSVSGATISSEAIKKAAAAALAEAGLTADMLVPVETQQAETETELSCDVVVVGGGAAGVTAAAKLTSEGKKVILLEKADKLGGNTVLSGGLSMTVTSEIDESYAFKMTDELRAIVEAHLAVEPANEEVAELIETVRQQYADYQASGNPYMFDTNEFYALRWFVFGRQQGNLKMMVNLCRNLEETYRFIQTMPGLEDTIFLLGGNESSSTSPLTSGYPVGGQIFKGSSFETREKLNAYQKWIAPGAQYVEENGSSILLGTAGTELLVNDANEICGVKAVKADGTEITISAHDVILATGNYGADTEMLEESLQQTLPYTASTPTNTGDGIRMALKVGATTNQMDSVWINVVTRTGRWYTYATAKGNDGIVVNANGERFIDEAIVFDWNYWREVNEQPNHVVFQLYNEACATRDASDADVYCANTIEDLAEQLGVDAEKLAKTVADYNAHIEAGTLTEMDIPNSRPNMSKLESPYYATALVTGCMFCYGGLNVNENMQVLNEAGEPIPHLYGAGEINWGIDTVERAYAAGINGATGEAFIAAKHILGL